MSVLAVAGAAGCLSRAEGHCGNNGGDGACGGATPYCSVCTLAADGCVAEAPRAECRAVTEAEGSSGGSGASSGGGLECTRASALDDACPAAAPYCHDGACAPCTAFDPGFCADLDPARPVCDEDGGRCVECTAAEPLCDAAEPLCAPDLECRGCWKHAQCPDSACDLGTGACMPTTTVVWVDPGACPGPGAGTEGDPFCELRSALQLPVDVLTIRLRAGSIQSEQLSVGQARTVAVRGEGGRPRLSSAGSYVVNASNGARLLLAGVDVLDGDPALHCSSAALWLEDVVVRPGPGGAVLGTHCDLHVGRSQIVDRDGHAIELRGRSTLALASSILGLDGTPDAATHAVYLRDESRAVITYSTLAANRSALPAASLRCEPGASATLRSSIALALASDSIDCDALDAAHNVVDVPLPGEANVEVAALSPAWFVDLTRGDFHVADVAATPFGGLGVWAAGDPYEDVDGDLRGPAAPGVDVVGADVP